MKYDERGLVDRNLSMEPPPTGSAIEDEEPMGTLVDAPEIRLATGTWAEMSQTNDITFKKLFSDWRKGKRRVKSQLQEGSFFSPLSRSGSRPRQAVGSCARASKRLWTHYHVYTFHQSMRGSIKRKIRNAKYSHEAST